jgi:hypothetical protein
MKKINYILFALLISVSLNTSAQSDKYASKVKTLGSTIKTLYAVISGEKGEARDWELFNYLFTPEAKLIPTGTNKKGVHVARYMTPKDYQNTSGKWLVENGFFEKEVARSVHKFGNIAQVFTTYEAFNHLDKTKPFMTGINSVQMLFDNNRWWIVNIYWQQASKQNPIPDAFKAKK